MVSLGLGLTNACNLRCAHCYREDALTSELSLAAVQEILTALPVQSVNLGTGENGLHPEFPAILDYLVEHAPKTTITSNGYSIRVLGDDQVARFASIEFSLDFPNQEEQDSFRGRDNWSLIAEQTQRCRALGVPVTITAVMMATNYDRLHEVARVAAELDATFRVNIYQAVRTDRFSLTYEQLWEGFRLLLAHTRLVTTTEPVLAAATSYQGAVGCGCGRTTVRVSPDGQVLPCVYVAPSGLAIKDLVASGEDIFAEAAFASFRTLPDACLSCDALAVCGGGCAGRRTLAGHLTEPDPYCPKRGNVRLSYRASERRDLPKAGSACTSIFEYVL